MSTSSLSGRRIVGYARVSTDKQRREGYSLDEQEAQIRAYATAMGWGPVAEIYVDVESGKTDERPALQRLIADARAGLIECVIVTHINRMGRNTLEFLLNDRLLQEAEVNRVYIKQNFDTSTPYGRFAVILFAAIAELEGHQIVEQIRDGQRRKVAGGELWGPPTYGYRYVRGDPATNTPGRWDIVEEEAAIVREIFTRIAQGESAQVVAIDLTLRKVPTHKGPGYMWRHSTISRMVRNPKYGGTGQYGRTVTVRKGRRQKHVKADPESVISVPFPAIVSPELQQAAIAGLQRNRLLAKRNAKRVYLLKGLLRCGACRDAGEERGMFGMPKVYACHRQDPETARFRRHTVHRARLDQAVWNAVRGMILDPTEILAIARAGAGEGRSMLAQLEQDIAAAERALAGIETERERLLDLYQQGYLDQARFLERDRALDERRVHQLEALAGLQAQRSTALAQALPLDEVDALCRRWAPALDELTPDERALLIQTLVDEIVVYKDRAVIKGALPAWSETIALPVGTGGPSNGSVIAAPIEMSSTISL